MTARRSFWAFSVELYDRPGVKDALLALQDRFGFPVNMVLWCLWAADQKIVVQEQDLEQLLNRAVTFDQRVVRNLRAARRYVSSPRLHMAPDALANFCADVLDVEIAAEKLEQHALESLTDDFRVSKSSDIPSQHELALKYFVRVSANLESPRIMTDEGDPQSPRWLFGIAQSAVGWEKDADHE